MIRRATPVSMSSSGGSVVRRLGRRRVALRSRHRLPRPRGLPARLSRTMPLELAQHHLRPLVAQQRQCDPLATQVVQIDVDHVQPFLVEWRLEDRRPAGSITSEPPQNVTDSSTPTRLTNTT